MTIETVCNFVCIQLIGNTLMVSYWHEGVWKNDSFCLKDYQIKTHLIKLIQGLTTAISIHYLNGEVESGGLLFPISKEFLAEVGKRTKVNYAG